MDKKRVTEIFKSHPTVDEFHFTTDGQAFAEKHHAESHARSLDKESPKVKTITRGENVDEPVKEPVKAPAQEPKKEDEVKKDSASKPAKKPAKKAANKTAVKS